MKRLLGAICFCMALLIQPFSATPVAACAAHHYRIYKTVEAGRTFTRVEELNRSQRVQELARIMVGENITESALKSAEEMLTEA